MRHLANTLELRRRSVCTCCWQMFTQINVVNTWNTVIDMWRPSDVVDSLLTKWWTGSGSWKHIGCNCGAAAAADDDDDDEAVHLLRCSSTAADAELAAKFTRCAGRWPSATRSGRGQLEVKVKASWEELLAKFRVKSSGLGVKFQVKVKAGIKRAVKADSEELEADGMGQCSRSNWLWCGLRRERRWTRSVSRVAENAWRLRTTGLLSPLSPSPPIHHHHFHA